MLVRKLIHVCMAAFLLQATWLAQVCQVHCALPSHSGTPCQFEAGEAATHSHAAMPMQASSKPDTMQHHRGLAQNHRSAMSGLRAASGLAAQFSSNESCGKCPAQQEASFVKPAPDSHGASGPLCMVTDLAAFQPLLSMVADRGPEASSPPLLSPSQALPSILKI